MRPLLRILLLVLGMSFAFSSHAIDPTEFRDAAEEARFRALATELRCVMCQNQSLADSNAPIARDLRLEVLRLMREGKDDTQVKEHLVARYSEFVLYQPRWNARNALLWIAPLLALIVGSLLITRIVRRRGKSLDESAARSPADQEW